MYGPNTNTSGGSIIVYLEAQARYLRQALQRVRDRGAGAIEVRREVEAASDRSVQERFAGTAWLDCQSWYRDVGPDRRQLARLHARLPADDRVARRGRVHVRPPARTRGGLKREAADSCTTT